MKAEGITMDKAAKLSKISPICMTTMGFCNTIIFFIMLMNRDISALIVFVGFTALICVVGTILSWMEYFKRAVEIKVEQRT